MKGLKNKLLFFNFSVLFVALLAGTPVRAALNIEMQAHQEGISVQYDMGLPGGSRALVLVPGDPLKEIFAVKQLIRLEAMIINMVPEEHKIEVHAKISSRFFPEGAIDVPLAIPFGSFGIYVNFKKRQFIDPEHHDIDVSLLLSKLHMRYAVEVDLGEFLYGQWEGAATPFDNTICETIVNPADGRTVAEIDLKLQHVSYFFTVFQYAVFLGSHEDNLVAKDEEKQTPQAISGTILLPNGSYHLWADFDSLHLE